MHPLDRFNKYMVTAKRMKDGATIVGFLSFQRWEDEWEMTIVENSTGDTWYIDPDTVKKFEEKE